MQLDAKFNLTRNQFKSEFVLTIKIYGKQVAVEQFTSTEDTW